MSTNTVTQLRSPEKVLSTIAATARLSGIAAPRRIAFSEPRPGEPLAVLSLSWESLADMRPWLSVFHIDSHRPGATTVYGDYAGWSLMLTSPAPVAICFCEVVHPLGCPGDLADAPECPSCGVLGGSHQESCYAAPFRTYDNGTPWLADVVKHLNATLDEYRDLPNGEKARIAAAVRKAKADRAEATRIAEAMLPSRVDVEAAAQIPVVDGTPAEIAALLDLGGPDLPIPLLPVDVTLPRRVPGAALAGNPPPDDADAEIAFVLADRAAPAHVVDVVTVDPDLDAGRGDAEIARIGVPVDLTRGGAK